MMGVPLLVFATLALLLNPASSAKLQLLEADVEHVPGEYLISFHTDPESTKTFKSVLSNWKEHFSTEPQHVGAKLGMNILHARLTDEEVEHVETLPGVEDFQHNLISKASQSGGVQNNPPSHLDRLDAGATPTVDQMYAYGSDGEGVDIYIIDTGVDTGHNDWAAGQANFLADCTRRTRNGCATTPESNPDPNGHGTHVAGIAASPTYGVAKRARIYDVRALDANGDGFFSGIIDAIGEAVANAATTGRPSVINMSLGGSLSNTLNNAVTNAVNAGVTVVVAAGNEAQNVRNVSPASAASVITVCSTTTADQLSSFSNFGTTVDICAVGSRVRSLRSNTDGSVLLSGTSMASPMVAGAAAMLLSVNGQLTPAEVAQTLRGTAVQNRISGFTGQRAGTPNLLLSVNNAAFEVDGPPVVVPPELPTATSPDTPSLPTPELPDNAQVVDTLDALDEVGNPGFDQGFLAQGLMFDVQCNENGGAATLNAITIYTNQQINRGTLRVAFNTNFQPFMTGDAARNGQRWTVIGDFPISTSNSQQVAVGQFNLNQITVVLPEPHEFAAATRQGLYVLFLQDDLRMAYDRVSLDDDQRLAENPPMTIFAGRAMSNRRGNGLNGILPVLEIDFASVEESTVFAQVVEEPGPRLNDQLDCMESVTEDETVENVGTGIMFDLTVDELATQDLPGVWLESFSVWLMDPMNDEVVEVYTTVNRGSYLGQETDEAAWVLVASRSSMEKDLNEVEVTEDPSVAVQGESMDDDGASTNPANDEDDMGELERLPQPELFDFDLGMHYELRRDGMPQGFYVTFRENQMMYYSDETRAEADEISSTDFVTMTGGKGVVNTKFGKVIAQRQFAGEACFTYDGVSANGGGSGDVDDDGGASTIAVGVALATSIFATLCFML